MNLVLASASPRRRQLLEQLGLTFIVAPADLDESVHAAEHPAAYVERLAREKAAAVAHQHSGAVVLAADTSVVVDGVILGKPGADVEEGARMLRLVAGRTHDVMTGIAVASTRGVLSQVVTTKVSFRSLTSQEIAWYVSSGEGRDKAGGYAIQGLGGAFITGIDGSSSGVIGLPLVESLALLERAGLLLPWSR